MAKMEQVLILDPSNELKFKGPFTDVVTAELKLKNPSDRRVCFKVKTTAPKRYCVRPNSGLIEPGGVVVVAVMLQPFEYDPSEKNKHKFMVQTLFAPDGHIDSNENLWKEATADQLMDSKIKCVFEVPSESATQNNLDQSSSFKGSSSEKSLPKTSNVDAELKKTLEENQRVKSELSILRQEYNKLQEAEVRLRKMAIKETVDSTPTAPRHHTPLEQASPSFPPFLYLVFAIIIGLIIGKLFL